MREYLDEWEEQALAFRIAEALSRTSGKTPEYVARAKENAVKKAALDTARERARVSRLRSWEDLLSEPTCTSTNPAAAASASDLADFLVSRVSDTARTALQHLLDGFSEQESAEALSLTPRQVRRIRSLIRLLLVSQL